MKNFTVHHDGDLIRRLEINKGFSQRPLWKTLENLSPQEMVIWVDRMDTLCPVSCEWALVQAFESAANIKVSTHIQVVRSIFSELNRLIYLMTYLSNMIKHLGVVSLYEQGMILREYLFRKQEEFTGSRILPQVICIGGVRRNFTLGDIQKVQSFVKEWKEHWLKWKELVIDDPFLEQRLSSLIKISPKNIKSKAIWGIIGKASGLIYDSRVHQPHGAYALIDFKLNYDFALKSDALSRFLVATTEVDMSLKACENFLSLLRDEDEKKPTLEFNLSEGIFTGVCESARGPVTSFLDIDSKGKVRGVRIFNCSQRLWLTIENYFAGSRTEDLELGWASLGVSAEEAEV
ncbi:MAG: hypothetical protein IPM57_01110 [Oligoflexia bacterium]|nr:hypothetical protein [Oligoflexia bacterium]